MTDPSNESRATRAQSHLHPFEPLTESIVDAIADLAHLATRERLDTLDLVRIALRHWAAETQGLAAAPAVSIRIGRRRSWNVAFTDVRHVLCTDIEAPTAEAAIAEARRIWLDQGEPHPSVTIHDGEPFLDPEATEGTAA